MGPKKPKDIETELRRAIEKDGRTVYRLSADSGVSAGQIHRFIAKERTLTLTAAGKLATALGLHLATEAPVPDDDVLAAIGSNAKGTRPARLADVFKTLQASHQALTLGGFHDAIRAMHAAGQIRLEPWTGAAYQLRDGQACLIVGTEIMAFAVPG